MRRLTLAVPCLLLGIVLSGCFAYAPVALDTVQPGADVRVLVTPEQARALDELLLREARMVDGRLLEVGADLLLEVPVASGLQGGAMQSLNQRVRLPRSEVLQVELRSLNRGRTGLVVGVAGAVVLGSVIHALSRELGGDTRGDPPPPGEYRGPIRSPQIRPGGLR